MVLPTKAPIQVGDMKGSGFVSNYVFPTFSLQVKNRPMFNTIVSMWAKFCLRIRPPLSLIPIPKDSQTGCNPWIFMLRTHVSRTLCLNTPHQRRRTLTTLHSQDGSGSFALGIFGRSALHLHHVEVPLGMCGKLSCVLGNSYEMLWRSTIMFSWYMFF